MVYHPRLSARSDVRIVRLSPISPFLRQPTTTLQMAGSTRRTESKAYYVNTPNTSGGCEAGVSSGFTRWSY